MLGGGVNEREREISEALRRVDRAALAAMLLPAAVIVALGWWL